MRRHKDDCGNSSTASKTTVDADKSGGALGINVGMHSRLSPCVILGYADKHSISTPGTITDLLHILYSEVFTVTETVISVKSAPSILSTCQSGLLLAPTGA